MYLVPFILFAETHSTVAKRVHEWLHLAVRETIGISSNVLRVIQKHRLTAQMLNTQSGL